MTNRQYLSCAETAKLVRLALKESFPGVKFGVRSSVYAGGASITVKYLDGPISKAVEEIAASFKGSYFDGMIDYKGSRYHLLDGAPVSFGSNFVFVERRLTKAKAEAIVAKVAEKFGRSDWAQLCGCEHFGYYVQQAVNGPRITDQIEEIEAALGAPAAKESPTLARIEFQGDDGYGQGTVGMPGGNGCAMAAKGQQEAAARMAAERAAAIEALDKEFPPTMVGGIGVVLQ